MEFGDDSEDDKKNREEEDKLTPEEEIKCDEAFAALV